ncbi:MAG TPA: ankyrin repeat domain-containing protein [Limnochordia bacterium]|nr:ankyrin repeat domain-containing protein [Limnochordia bacterium]
MPKVLPRAANLEQLKKQAKELRDAQHRREPDALERVAAALPRLAGGPTQDAAAGDITLTEAQLVLAREYGFASWPRLKRYVEAAGGAEGDALEQFKRAVKDGDAARLRTLFAREPALKHVVDEPLFAFDGPAVVAAKHELEVLDVLLENGADINARSHWWAGSFGVLDDTEPELADQLIKRGAKIDIHAAAGLGRLDLVRELVAADPALVNAKGGDGQRPLHFAATTKIIDFLLDHGAEIDARDLDHLGTPAQYKVREPELCRHLIRRGAAVDIFMACALGDVELARRVLDADPDCITARIGDGGYPPVPDAPGGHIYFYKLAPGHTPHQVATRLAPQAVYDLLMARSPAVQRLLAACDRADAAAVRRLLAETPDLLTKLDPDQRGAMAAAAWENRLEAVRVMLDAGFDPHWEGAERSTPLERAAWHGFADVVGLLLERDPKPPLEHRNQYGATPLGMCLHGSQHSWRKDGDHAAVAEMLIAAGAALPDRISGSDAVAAVLRRHGVPE